MEAALPGGKIARPGGHKKGDLRTRCPKVPGGCVRGGYLLSRFRSIIDVARFNFSVRDGKRWSPRAMAALIRWEQLTPEAANLGRATDLRGSGGRIFSRPVTLRVSLRLYRGSSGESYPPFMRAAHACFLACFEGCLPEKGFGRLVSLG